mmetsp:Transcript_92858/g.300319  ORF Transcript_92858/g.300319 Transcript_92858/m.300319 type:complete len:116 (+) Transcript_92858:160-507(+)|eukprot:CAMPEP_0203963462 /NCGR_PEP_ID=MMETSP0359-20131031/93408_1 /ASSEMBLY_ACC=CAM_ASM_000338 /TAXON_ID=268821 /ORGANISM="Scrippsiella Hangoei, Strain SHTV-5" /LENGTH=115 /DNA_ID=CAMNT_0050899311 /DNA_START=143 /DNA_END=490 /DNA_ORIENTATION=-
MVADQVLLLAVEDVLQVLLVIVCVYAGWSAWSLLLHFLAVGAVPSGKAKMVDCPPAMTAPLKASRTAATTVAAAPAESEGEEEVGAPVVSDSRQQARAILEHYSVFGAPVGVWNA